MNKENAVRYVRAGGAWRTGFAGDVVEHRVFARSSA
jgi:hypothetical protein